MRNDVINTMLLSEQWSGVEHRIKDELNDTLDACNRTSFQNFVEKRLIRRSINLSFLRASVLFLTY